MGNLGSFLAVPASEEMVAVSPVLLQVSRDHMDMDRTIAFLAFLLKIEGGDLHC